MTAAEIAFPIDLNLPTKLRDRDYRRKFFLAEASAYIAKQLVDLRKRRGLSQTQVADLIDTKQPAISRVEKASYRNWSFNTLRNIADALDARIRVFIQPWEDVLSEYEEDAAGATASTTAPQPSAQEAIFAGLVGQTTEVSLDLGYYAPFINAPVTGALVAASEANKILSQTYSGANNVSGYFFSAAVDAKTATLCAENAQLKNERARLADKIARLELLLVQANAAIPGLNSWIDTKTWQTGEAGQMQNYPT